MTGVKGKSGRVTTPEQREARRRAASLGGQAKRDRQRKPAEKASKKPRHQGMDGEFPVETWIDYKDKLACDLAKRKIEQADIDVATSRVTYEKARGELLTVKEVEAEQERLVGIYRARLASVVEFVITLVPPDQINEVRAKAITWLDKTQAEIAAEIEGA